MFRACSLLILILTNVVTTVIAFEDFNGGYMTWEDDGETLMFECFVGFNFFEATRVFNNTKTVKKVFVLNCSVPPVSYHDTFKLVNIDVRALESLQLQMNAESPLTKAHFEGLPIKHLEITYENMNAPIYSLAEDLFETLKLAELKVTSALIPELIESRYENGYRGIEKLTLSHDALLGSFKSCANLRKLTLVEHNLEWVTKGWLMNCSSLESVIITDYQIRDYTLYLPVLLDVLSGVKSLRHLTLSRQNIGAFNDGENEDTYRNDALSLSTVYDLNLSESSIDNKALLYLLRHTPALKSLSLSNAAEVILDTRGQEQRLKLNLLRYINIDSTSISTFRMDNIEANSLKLINMSNSNGDELAIKGLPFSTKRYIIDLRGTSWQDIVLDEEDYRHLKDGKKKIRFIFDKDPEFPLLVDCDCEHGWLARALRESLLTVPKLQCEGRSEIINEPAERLECDKYKCSEGCECRRAWSNNAVDMICKNVLQRFPRNSGLRSLKASGNHIKEMNASDLVDSIVFLDISFNNVGRLNDDAIKTLFSVASRRMQLAGNPIICDCRNKLLLEALHAHSDQVLDFINITCEDGRFVKDLILTELCIEKVNLPFWVMLTMSVIFGLIALAILTFVFCYLYRRYLRVFLYGRGWGLWCVRKEENSNRRYDAFVSFSHKDNEFVTDVLLPGLEKEPFKFKLCVHYRDWMVGEWIPTQITRSVYHSHRTIIVLSKNFIKSRWALLELRSAHNYSMRKRRSRPFIVIIAVDDVLTKIRRRKRLNAQFRDYISNHLCLRWGERWFWEKLWYALPHKRKPSSKFKRII